MELSQFLSDIKIRGAADLNIAFILSHSQFQKSHNWNEIISNNL